MFIMDGLVVNWKAVAKFLKKTSCVKLLNVSSYLGYYDCISTPARRYRFCVESADKVAQI